MLADDLVGVDLGGGREAHEGGVFYIYIYTHTHTYTWLIHIVVQQKLTQHCNYSPIKKKESGLGYKTDLSLHLSSLLILNLVSSLVE